MQIVLKVCKVIVFLLNLTICIEMPLHTFKDYCGSIIGIEEMDIVARSNSATTQRIIALADKVTLKDGKKIVKVIKSREP